MLPTWRTAFRPLNRMFLKCRLSWQSGSTRFAAAAARKKRAGNSGGTTSSRAVDSAYLLAVFFVSFLLLMLTCQLMIMRSELGSDGKSHHRSSSHGRPALRFGRQVAPFGRALAASPHQSGSHHPSDLLTPSDPNVNPLMTAGEWIHRLPQEQSRDAWVDTFWQCFQGQGFCPWQPVAGPDKSFVFSAYLDDSALDNPKVRIIGVARTKKPDKVWCQLGWTSSTNETNNNIRWSQVPGQIKVIREHWNLRFSAVFILCPLKSLSSDRAPEVVSISTFQHPIMPDKNIPKPTANREEFNASYGHWSETPTGNILPIIQTSLNREFMADEDSYQHELTVCVKPLHYNFNRASQLIEFIEMHRLLGVSHFTFYNHTIGDRVDCVLRRYIKEGLVEVLPWHELDVTSQKEIRTEAIFASLNDCLYRHKHDSQYLLMIDLDEFIIPRTNNGTLTDLLKSALKTLPPSKNEIGAFYFRNAFFYLSWPDDSNLKSTWKSIDLELISLQKTRRTVKLHPHRIRSKYICDPRAVVEVGNHFIWEFRPGHVAAHMPDSMAIMHHYRTCEYGGESCLTNPSMDDRSTWKYGDALVRAVQKRLEEFKSTCTSLIELSLPPSPPFS